MSEMSRREFLSIGAVASVGLFAGCGLGSLSASQPSGRPAGKMNVLFIAVDDLRPLFGAYGNKNVHSPNLDRLASWGMLFDKAYCQQAVCGPSRASVLSGLRPDSTGIYGLETPLRKALPDILSLPEHFKNNGYHTASFGKIYHHADDDLQGWSIPPFKAGTFPDGKPWTGRGYNDPESVRQVKEYAAKNKGSAGRGPAFEAADVPDESYPDGYMVKGAIEHLRKCKDNPFFLAVGFYKPHLPFNCPKKYWDMYRHEEIELPDNMFLPKDMPNFAATSWGELRAYCGIPGRGPLDESQARNLIHAYYACVSYMDAQLGKLLDEVERLGLKDKTAIVLWGDHGWKLGEHGLWSKHTNFELDTHGALLAYVPGMKAAGKKTAALTEFVDIYPTLCDAAGIEIPKHTEGRSFLPLLDDPGLQWKQAALSQYPRGKVMGYSMRTQRYRYTRWQDRKTGRLVAAELYDHQRDPQENTNVADKPDYRKDRAMLDELFKKHWTTAKTNS